MKLLKLLSVLLSTTLFCFAQAQESIPNDSTVIKADSPIQSVRGPSLLKQIEPIFGLNSSNLAVTSDDNNRTGFTLGVRMPGLRMKSFETGLLINQRGAQSQNGDLEPLQLTYLSIPVGVRLALTGNRSRGLYTRIELQPSILIGLEGGAITDTNRLNRDQIESVDTLGVVGLGYRIQQSAGRSIFLELAYERGLMDLNGDFAGVYYNQSVTTSLGIDL
jgi:hypothetical protein